MKQISSYKSHFFSRPLHSVMNSFKPGQGWPNFSNSCNDYIGWTRWNDTCDLLGIPEYKDLPKKCYLGEASLKEEVRLKEFLLYLFSTKTTKTFADLL